MREPPDSPIQVLDESEETYCYGHPKTPTRLRCSRCERPICGRCAIPASVGQHCPDCVAEARRTAPRVRTVLRATAPAVYALIVVNVIVYAAQLLIPPLTRQFGSTGIAVAEGEWWRLFTAMFLHAPTFPLHILFNMMVLFLYGSNVEQAFGTARFVLFYFVTGFVASATSYAFGSCSGISVGASGAIFGIVGVLFVYLYNRRASGFISQYLRGLLFFIGLNLVLGLALRGIDNFAHLGGLAAGMVVGAGFDRRAAGEPGAPGLLQIAAAVGVAALGIALFAWRTATFTCAPTLFG